MEESEIREKYRQDYIKSEQEMQDELDKTLIKLSGAAFLVTFAFVDNFIQDEPITKYWLIASWLCWGASIVSSLYSYYLSTKAFREAIKQIDNNVEFKDIDPGGKHTIAVMRLNKLSLFLFTVGIVCISIFVTNNL